MRQQLRTGLIAAVLLAALSIQPFTARADSHGDGLIVKTSAFGVTKTLDRLGIVLERAGITVFARIDHAKGAGKVGLDLPPTALIIFGNPKLGTPLMQSNQKIGLDLPLKALAWQEADGSVKLGYTDPAWLAKRHGIADRDSVFQKMAGALKKFTDMAVTKGGLPKQ
ncbi:DUF302 domain-containing protein [Nisaea acidiphila]|uniref:DUF302 domain-containing protein n=1 Tax=Nisaea acidiphila TaxID=1862145 RepID=A0A9J7API9_9PROT|nr:DUF302 domain-containing protein [Nisaea acidiphila]UUX49127.1 DUF302 domain-containing protein [Nisaea acidiphila]